MSNPKYRINESHFEKHGVARLERDGFTKTEIMKKMYDLTPGMSQVDRTALVKDLYDRKGEC